MTDGLGWLHRPINLRHIKMTDGLGWPQCWQWPQDCLWQSNYVTSAPKQYRQTEGGSCLQLQGKMQVADKNVSAMQVARTYSDLVQVAGKYFALMRVTGKYFAQMQEAGKYFPLELRSI